MRKFTQVNFIQISGAAGPRNLPQAQSERPIGAKEESHQWRIERSDPSYFISFIKKNKIG